MLSQRQLCHFAKQAIRISQTSYQAPVSLRSFSNEYERFPNPKVTYDETVRSSATLKIALKSLVDAQHLTMIIPSDDPMRKIKNQQESDNKQWEETLIENRVRPSVLIPLIDILFTGIGFLTGILGKQVASRAVLLIEKIMEEYHDESLRILNEQDIDAKALRKLLCEVRDNGYDITDEMIERYQIKPTETEEKIAQVPKFILKTLFDITKKL